MSSDGALVSLAAAQRIFDSLPAELRIPTLSPRYVAADARRDPLLMPLFFVWQQESALLLHSFHEARVPGRDENDWQSAYGYGGAIRVGLDQSTAGEGWRALDDVALARSVVAEFIRFHPVIANHVGYPGTVRPDRAVVQIDLTERDLIGSYGGRARTTVRKALNRGLEASWLSPEGAKERFPDFYRDGMRQIGASDFYVFTDEYFAELLQLPGARVLAIAHEGAPVSMGLFLFGPRTVEYHLSATTGVGRDAGATSLLLHVAAQLAQESGCTGLFLGGGTDARTDNPLLLFKRSFAPPTLHFHIGYRIHLNGAYAQMKAALPDLAATGRVLFYRR
jgi:hypothetical protein